MSQCVKKLQCAYVHSWEGTDEHKTKASVGILIYMGLFDLPGINYYFSGIFYSLCREAIP